MTDYTPVDCGLYSSYEAAILQRKCVRLSWSQANGQLRMELLRPVDLSTRNHEEFLVAETLDGRILELRLDRIITAEFT